MINKQKISQALTTGLLAGYVDKSTFNKITRGGFELTSSHFTEDDIVYHDEWTNGGGQEIVKVEDQIFTRVYAGGAIGDTKEVIQKLIYFLQNLKDKTRLFENCSQVDGDWEYEYKNLDIQQDLEITTGKETIKYKNKTVFVHCFVLSPIAK